MTTGRINQVTTVRPLFGFVFPQNKAKTNKTKKKQATSKRKEGNPFGSHSLSFFALVRFFVVVWKFGVFLALFLDIVIAKSCTG